MSLGQRGKTDGGMGGGIGNVNFKQIFRSSRHKKVFRPQAGNGLA